MATVNAVGNGLTGQSGSGLFVGSQAPSIDGFITYNPPSFPNNGLLLIGASNSPANFNLLVTNAPTTIMDHFYVIPDIASAASANFAVVPSPLVNGHLVSASGVNGLLVDSGIPASSIPVFNPWVNVTSSSQPMTTNTGYTSNAGASLVTFTLPLISAEGDFVEILGEGTGLWTITYSAGQQIKASPGATTITSGSLSSVNPNDNVRLRCMVANTIWTIVSEKDTGLDVV